MAVRFCCFLLILLLVKGQLIAQVPTMAPFQPAQPGKGPAYPLLPYDPAAAQNAVLLQNSVMTLPGNSRKVQQLQEYKSIVAELKEDEKKAAQEAAD